MDPIIGSALITGGLGLLSGLAGNRGASKNVKAQIKAQREENALTREHNLMLARQQNAWNVEQYEREQQDYLSNWNRQNEYDAPAAQMERFKAAGLNPNLALGSMTDSGTISTSSAAGSMTAGAPATSADMSAIGRLPTLGDALQKGLDRAMQGAQIEAIKANTAKVKSETEGTNLDNKLKASTMEIEQALKQGELTMKNLEIKGLQFDVEKMKPEQLKMLTANINKMSAESSQIMQQVQNLRKAYEGMDLDNAIKRIEKDMKRPMMESTIKQIVSQTGLNYVQAEEISTLLALKAAGLDVSNRLTEQNIKNAKGQFAKVLQEVRGLRIDNDRLALEFNADSEYLRWKPNSIINMSANILSPLSKILPMLGK